MHLCPDCEDDCDCDGEDLFHDTAPADCSHDCDDPYDEDLDDDDGYYDE